MEQQGIHKQTHTSRRGVTLVELMLTVLIATIVMLTLGIMLVDMQRGWNRLYNRTYESVAADAYVSRRVFDRYVRKATIRRYAIGGIYNNAMAGSSLEVYYYGGAASPDPDTFARFYVDGGGILRVETGLYDWYEEPWPNPGSGSAVTDEILAEKVENVQFLFAGSVIKMVLYLDSGQEDIVITSSAVRHNP